jgi:hypothetical protein
MTQDMSGQGELQAVKREILAAVAELGTELRADIARIDATTSETAQKVQYLCDHLLGDSDKKELRRAAGGR